jgi:hypothetical protein
LPEDGNEAGFQKKLCVFNKSDSGQSTKQEVLYIDFSHAVFCLLFMLGDAGFILPLHGSVHCLMRKFKVTTTRM